MTQNFNSISDGGLAMVADTKPAAAPNPSSGQNFSGQMFRFLFRQARRDASGQTAISGQDPALAGDARPAGSRGEAVAPLVFFHIGKTGGSSLIAFLEGACTHSLIEQDSDEVAAIEAALRGSPAQLIAGHYAMAPVLKLLPPDWLTMTVIRDPLWHLPSQYWHLRAQPTAAAGPALRQLIDTCNAQDFAALLIGEPDAAFATYFDNPQTRAVTGKKTGPITWRDLAEAKDILSRLSLVGTTERIDALAARAAAMLPWAHGLQGREMPHVMVNPRNAAGLGELPAQAGERLRTLTVLDTALYRHAAALQARWLPVDTAGGHGAAATAVRSRALPVADLVRVYTPEHERRALGDALHIRKNEVLLHPPAGANGCTAVTINDIPLDGHGTLAGKLILAHPAAAPVRFDMALTCGEGTLLEASFVVGAERSLDVRLVFAAAAGPGRLRLATRMAMPAAINSFAWATFVDFTIS